MVNKESSPHRIVVVGGGAAGLELVTALGRRYGKRGAAEITLIDSARTHLWKPLLHAVAAGSLDANEEALNYLAHAHANHYRYRLGEMVGLDRAAREVKLAASFDDEGRQVTPARGVPYDTLVLAIGSVTNDFGTPGAAEHAVPLETPEQAARFNRRVINACIRAQSQDDPVRPGQLHVAVIGAGATGTELAAELHHTVRQIVATGLDRIKPAEDIKIVLIEAAPRILPALTERISLATTALLARLDVEVRVGARVTKVGPDGVTLASGEFVPAELVVWAAGVKGPDVLATLDGLEVTRSQQLAVLPTLQTTRDPDVFAIGDCAACPREGFATPVPPRAQAAHQQASHMLGQIARRFKGEALAPFHYRDFGSLVSLGRQGAVGSLMGLVGRGFYIDGLMARLMYYSLHKMHQHAVHGSARVLADTISQALSRRRDRQVKLH
jgi:NADH dehydrogenase